MSDLRRPRHRRALAGVSATMLAVGLLGCSSTSDGGAGATTTTPAGSTGRNPATTAAPGGIPGGYAAAACAATQRGPTSTVEVTSDGPTESSGLVLTDDGAWVLDDSGNPAALHRIEDDGSVQTVSVAGVTNTDWEELIADPTPGVAWVADIGDNRHERDTRTLHRIELPGPGATSVTPTRTLTVTFADDQPDIEAGFIDGDHLYLLTKAVEQAPIYEVPLDEGDDVVAEAVGEFRAPGAIPLVTGAAIAPDGSTVLVRTYLGAWAYPVDDRGPVAALESGEPCQVAVGDEAQGEAIAFMPDGTGHATIGEGDHPTLSIFVP